MNVLLISAYEGGLQPLSLALAGAHLLAAGHRVVAVDLSLEDLRDDCIQAADLIAFSIPLFDALKPAVDLARTLQSNDRKPPIVAFGAHAMIHCDILRERYVDAVIMGDCERALVEIANRCSAHATFDSVAGVATAAHRAAKVFVRDGHLVPARHILPPLTSYEYAACTRRLGPGIVVGNMETARGCRFECSYCSVFAAYQGKVVPQDENVLLADLDQLIGMGAAHICFVDADFLNAPGRAVRFAGLLHDRHPEVTFDFTSRADLLAADVGRLARLVECGARFVTSAFEFPSTRVLNAVNKGFDVVTLERAICHCRAVGLALNPTFIRFNPWVDARDLADLERWLDSWNLRPDVSPPQFQSRLWLYRGSPLLEHLEVQDRIVEEDEFLYRWRHRDPAVEAMFATSLGESSVPAGRCCLKC